MANKMTKVAKFNAIAEIVGSDATFEDGTSIAEFLAHEVEMTERRNHRKSTSPSKKSIENAEIAQRIREFLAENDKATASEIAKALDLSSPQKVSGVVKYADGIYTTKDGRKTVYTLSEEE